MPDTRDVFISYARPSENDAQRIAAQLRDQGFSVWRDDELPAHRAYSEVIEERLKSAKAVVVLWSAESGKSHWVRAEADTAREAGTLVQASLDGTLPPMPFNQIQCADLKGWDGDRDSPGWRKLEGSVASLVGGTTEDPDPAAASAARVRVVRASVCVLPFVNMSGDPEQEYFSDGISEDITTDLSKVSALEVVARNTAFSFKGQNPDVKEVAKQLSVSHVLEGSVRKAGNRIRINAQLIDGSTSKHLWADRFDRDLTDIFEIQDEISKAIVDALKVTLLPAERKAIETRGTSSVDAYNLYLMARQQWITGSAGDIRRDETIVRICNQALTFDQNYAQAWALMALAQSQLRMWHARDENPLPAAEKALEINPNLAEARCIKAHMLEEQGKPDEAIAEIKMALRSDPESWEVNREAGRLMFRQGRFRDAIPFFQKATALVDIDWHNAGMLTTCYHETGDVGGLRGAAQMTVERVEKALARDPSNASALASGAGALVTLGEPQRARDWIDRALLLDPDNILMRYNLACALAYDLNDNERALEVITPYFERTLSVAQIKHADVDPDLDPIRDDPRFVDMMAAAKERLGMTETAA
jgi:adenylate cyclase